MSQIISGIVCHSALAEKLTNAFPGDTIKPLAQDYVLLPLDQQRARQNGDESPIFPSSYELTERSAAVLARLSFHGDVAFIEAEYYGADGFQTAIVWRAGAIVYGPSRSDQQAATGTAYPDAVSGALRMLGARYGDVGDEFQALGLGRYRRV